MKQVRRILICYFYLLVSNVGVFGYEMLLVHMTLYQSAIARLITLVTDWFEAVLFVDSKWTKKYADRIVEKLPHRYARRWVQDGLRWALIGPPFYAVKLVLINAFLAWQDVGIEPINWWKVGGACGISFCMCFLWGALYERFLEPIGDRGMQWMRARWIWRRGSEFFGLAQPINN